MIDNELAERFKSILEKEMNEISKELAKNSKNKLSDLVREHFEDLQAIVKIKREKKLGGYEYVAYLISSSGIEVSADTLKTIMWRIKNEKLQKKRKSHPKNLMLDPQKELTDKSAPNLATDKNLPKFDPESFSKAFKENYLYFRDLPDEYHDDYDLGCLAVSTDYRNYNYLSLRLKENVDIASIYLNKHISAEGITLKLRSDKEFMLQAVKIYCRNYYRIADNLKGDKDIARAAIAENPKDSNFVTNVIKDFENDTEFAKYVVRLNYDNMHRLTPELKEKLKDFLEEEYQKIINK